MTEKVWYIYMIRCKGGVLYTGITTDVQRRFKEHKSGKGAKFLRGKAPLTLVYQQQVGNHSDALKVEIKIKKFSKIEKETMILAGESPSQS
ncbi:MAG: GIY-YIG nuclease family protein [Mariprofundaceae bacterium]|nr:GIY-YIG nuclease family protein [Mariprofundaceae bacterium]